MPGPLSVTVIRKRDAWLAAGGVPFSETISSLTSTSGRIPPSSHASSALSTASFTQVSSALRGLSKPSRCRFLVKNSETEISRWRAPISSAVTPRAARVRGLRAGSAATAAGSTASARLRGLRGAAAGGVSTAARTGLDRASAGVRAAAARADIAAGPGASPRIRCGCPAGFLLLRRSSMGFVTDASGLLRWGLPCLHELAEFLQASAEGTSGVPRPPGLARLASLMPDQAADQERIASLDILRGLALLGMLIVHFHQLLRLEVKGPEDLIPWAVWILLEQKAWGTFAFLFGAGFALQLGRFNAHGVSVVPTYLRRLGMLALFGIVAGVGFGFHILLEY